MARLVLFIAAAAGCDNDAASPDPPETPGAEVIDGLWTVSGITPAIQKLAPSQLLGSGSVTAATAVTTSSATLLTLNGIAFDPTGTLWIASRIDSLILAFAPAALGTSGEREATIIIAPTDGSLSGPTALAFDSYQRLWVANFDQGTIVRFDSKQLAATGAPVPTTFFHRTAHPTALAFDAAGALWVSDVLAQTITKYSAAQLEEAFPAPDVVLSVHESSLSFPAGMAFDATGNLWVASTGNGTVVAYSPAELALTGSPTPRIKLESNAGSLTLPTGLAFDSRGSLWVINVDGVLSQFNRTDLLASGAPAPNVRMQLSADALFWSLAFWPKPRGLPLN